MILLDGEPAPAAPGTTVTDTAPPVAWSVPKLRAVDRIIAAGLAEIFMYALASDALAKLRFDAATEIASDDGQVRAFLSAIGADPDSILAP